MHAVLLQMTIYLAAAVIAVPVSQRLGFGSVLGYLAAGVAIGPILHLVAEQESEGVRHYAEFGVVLMLFLVGLELRARTLWDMRRRLLGLGSLQVGLTAAIIAGVAMLAGNGWAQAVAIGLILSLSSTAIVIQTLSEKRLTRTEGGGRVLRYCSSRTSWRSRCSRSCRCSPRCRAARPRRWPPGMRMGSCRSTAGCAPFSSWGRWPS